MINRLATLLAILCLTSAMAPAQKTGDFCDGFSEGWKSVKGNLGIVPICPIEPITPIGSTPYREGLKAGAKAAERLGGTTTGGALSPKNSDTFCDGFSDGWKAVKGVFLGVVPICPIAPVTPVGSTPYGEGVKAGENAAEKSGGARAREGIMLPLGKSGTLTFCAGFAAGWQAVKRRFGIVPICPIAPVTPIGSTPWREGLKAGMAKARSGF